MTASEQQQNQISSKGVKGLERGIERRLVDLIRIPSSARGYLLPFHPSLVWSRKSILSDFFIVVPRMVGGEGDLSTANPKLDVKVSLHPAFQCMVT